MIFSWWVLIFLKGDLFFLFSFFIGGVELLTQETWKWSWAVWYIDCIKSTSFLEVLDTVLSHMQRPGPCPFIQLHNFDAKGSFWCGLHLIDLGPYGCGFLVHIVAHRKWHYKLVWVGGWVLHPSISNKNKPNVNFLQIGNCKLLNIYSDGWLS